MAKTYQGKVKELHAEVVGINGLSMNALQNIERMVQNVVAPMHKDFLPNGILSSLKTNLFRQQESPADWQQI